MKNIRNFCIIAHIDHGKSTLADRLLELTGVVSEVDKKQMLDTMELEQERGITIKMTPARMQWKGIELNLIDTPWHVDFQYEVSRSLSAVEWVILLVDASQGIQAQTLSTLYMALENDLVIIPVLNKVDLPAADTVRVTKELENTIGIDVDEVICISAKTGENVEMVLDAIIERIENPEVFKQGHVEKFRIWNQEIAMSQAPRNDDSIWERVSRALIFDSVFDPYKWVVAYVKMVDGDMKTGDTLHLIHSEKNIVATEVGYFTPKYVKNRLLKEGQIGYIVTGQKSVRDAKIGDTILKLQAESLKQQVKQKTLSQYLIPGFEAVKPFVFAGVYPIDSDQYNKMKSSFEKLALNDSAITRGYEHSQAMGHGFRCGFLGMLHMDIVKERLWREYGIETIFTTPTVTYLVKSRYMKDERILSGMNVKELFASGLYTYLLSDEWRKFMKSDEYQKKSDEEKINELSEELKQWLVVKSGGSMPEQGMVEEIREPIVEVEIVGPDEYSGNIMSLCQEYRGEMTGMEYMDEKRVVRKYHLPMGEIVIDFYDRLKSITRGYATMNYEFKKYQKNDLVRLDMWINYEKVEAFSLVVHKDKAQYVWRDLVKKLKVLIPKHMFAIPIQAGIWTKMIARETISAMRKDVIAKCYGWDISRKKKLLKKQKEGKKKMKQMGSVSVPGDVFMKMVQR